MTPMQQIQKKRSKWRTKQAEDLEDTWGSLNLFNKSHRGRLSLDMAGEQSLSCFCAVLLCFGSPAAAGFMVQIWWSPEKKNVFILRSLSFFCIYIQQTPFCSSGALFLIHRHWNIHLPVLIDRRWNPLPHS